MEIEEVKKEAAKIIQEELRGMPYKAFFFGSRISKTASPTSDLDIGIEGEKPISSEIIRKIRERMETLRTLISIDVVDFSNVAPDFKAVAKAHIEQIFP